MNGSKHQIPGKIPGNQGRCQTCPTEVLHRLQADGLWKRFGWEIDIEVVGRCRKYSFYRVSGSYHTSGSPVDNARFSFGVFQLAVFNYGRDHGGIQDRWIATGADVPKNSYGCLGLQK